MLKSKCCNSDIKVMGDVTKFNVCVSCGKACDLMKERKTFTTRELSRNTKDVMNNLPCIITFFNRPIAIINEYEQTVQDVQSSRERESRKEIQGDSRDFELPSVQSGD